MAVWYLVVPPNLPRSSEVDTSAPLSHWIRLGYHEYNTQEQCEDDLEDSRQQMSHVGARINAKAFEASQCVSSDDPRMKADQPPAN